MILNGKMRDNHITRASANDAIWALADFADDEEMPTEGLSLYDGDLSRLALGINLHTWLRTMEHPSYKQWPYNLNYGWWHVEGPTSSPAWRRAGMSVKISGWMISSRLSYWRHANSCTDPITGSPVAWAYGLFENQTNVLPLTH